MAQAVMQKTFSSGELAPALFARVDLAKYSTAVALGLNFFVDYRGGLSTRPGTKYILQAYKSATAVRLIPFQASFTVGYMLEFGDQYIRFFNAGAPVLEATKAITSITQANPGVLTSAAHGYSVGEWVYIAVTGMTQLTGKYYIINTVPTANTYTLKDLFGVVVNTTAYSAFAAGTSRRVYTIASPYAAADLAKIKFAQNVNVLILSHPSYQTQVLTLVSATNWTLLPIVIGTTITTPTSVVVTSTLAGGGVNYSYVVTAVDVNGQESNRSAVALMSGRADLRTASGTNTISWVAVSGAVSYNVYKAIIGIGVAISAGAAHGYIGNCSATDFNDTNINADFSLTPPIPKNPFQGAGVASATVTVNGAYTTVPTVTLTTAPSSGVTAIVRAVLQITAAAISATPGINYVAGDAIYFPTAYGIIILFVDTVGGGGEILTFKALTFPGTSLGAVTSGDVPTNPFATTSSSGPGSGATINLTWGVTLVQIVSPGAGYLVAPLVTFVAAGATATTTLAPASNGYASVPGYFQQRLVLAGQTQAPQAFFMSQPGQYYNFNVSDPIQPNDAIEGTLVSGQLNTIKSLVPQPSGLVVLSDKASWLINGGSQGSAVSPDSIVANAQSFNGTSDVPPIVANFDILYVQAKGSVIRDTAYKFESNVFTGTDISVLSSHLFYGYQILEWAWAEEPYKVVWAVRDDGVMLTLTFLKEQELIGWCHSTTAGLFKSVATITEGTSFGSVDAIYTVVQRTVNGQSLKYIERVAERIFTNGAADAWCVDSGLQYSGAPATSFSGGEHLAGLTVTGLRDGVVITPFVMPANGAFTLASSSKVTVGLAFTPQMQTLGLDLGEPTVQGKMKKIPDVTLRCQDTLGLSIGRSFTSLVAMKDLVVGNVGSMTNTVVTGLVTGDVNTIVDPKWDVSGQYCIQQSFPFPATILGVIPNIVVGDTNERSR